MFRCNCDTFICTLDDLKEMWFQAWLHSKGMDKGEGLEVDFREKTFNEFIEKALQKVEEKKVEVQPTIQPQVTWAPLDYANKLNVVYGDPIEGKVIGQEDDEKTE